MSDYCTSLNIVPLVQLSTANFSTSTKPTLAQVNNYISQRTAELNVAMINESVALPITDTNTLKVLELYCSLGTACLVLMNYGQNFQTVSDSQAQTYCNSYSDFLKKISDNPGAALGNVIKGNLSTFDMTNQIDDGTHDSTNYLGTTTDILDNL